MEYKEQIRNFLKDKENYSLLITGSWGVGKTYLWKEIENEINPADDEIKFWDEFKSNFSFCNHVLLLIKFIKTYIINFFIFIKDYFLNELRTKPTKKNIIHISLFGKEHYKEILEEITLKAYIYKKILYLFRSVTFWKISVGTFLQFFIKDDFKNLIVCFDDLERKSSKLNMKDILGLINKLKEEKCKVVLISNKDEINEEDKETFEDYKEKCIDLEMQIKSRTEVILQILKEKSPEISKEIVPDAIYKIKNLRNLNKIIDAFKFFNKELQFSEYLKKENKYKALFEFVFKKIISKFDETIDLNDINKEKEKYIPMEYMSEKIIDDMIQNYFNNTQYFISHNKKEGFKKELKNYKFYVDLVRLGNLLKGSIQDLNKNNEEDFKKEIEEFFNRFDKEKLNDLIYNLGFINFIALDQTFHFKENEKIIEMKKYCLRLSNYYNYDEKFINIICGDNKELKEYYEKLKTEKMQETNLDLSELDRPKFENKYKNIGNYNDFSVYMKRINQLSKEEIEEFLENKMIFSFCDISFNKERSDKNYYPRLYEIYESIKNSKS